ncbi:MAG: hypothetical protein A3F09_04570 [Chlamydiae bacterium RIFCSPHIGHO2_12_FULL_49_11]|nr:MAG: hypothetical protein A3F09_04570 [Chlamydiae bacterium RIFCSPHIGHO2_12_FULL_49_11]
MKKKRAAPTFVILTLHAGSGHLQAAAAYRQKILETFPSATIVECDPLKEWLGWIGNGFTQSWNSAQRCAKPLWLAICVLCRPVLERVTLPFFFVHAAFLIYRHRPEAIYDTQILATRSIIWALKLFHTTHGRKIAYYKILTDFPTPVSTHFLSPIRSLSKGQKNYLTLITTKPFTVLSETEQDFWEKRWKLPLSHISYLELPIRSVFQKQGIPVQDRISLEMPPGHEETLPILKKQHIPFTLSEREIIIPAPQGAKIITLTLGTHANVPILKGYIDLFIKHYLDKPLYLLLLYGHAKNCRYLFPFLHDTIDKSPGASIKLIPVPFQNAASLSLLYAQSHAIITRASGITSMELFMQTSGNIWIHFDESPIMKTSLMRRLLPKGMPVWERGNALYLRKHKKARMLSFRLFSHLNI